MNRYSVLLAGLPGKMAQEVALVLLEEQEKTATILDIALSGKNADFHIDERSIRLVGAKERQQLDIPSNTIAIDFTQPDAAIDNITFYCERAIPFVMGTTGYSVENARALVESSSIPAVMAPNMAVPIILLQAAVRSLANEFPGALSHYNFSCTESHQSWKKDTSGTAKALLADFSKLGLPANVEDITKIRDAKTQRTQLNIPEEHLAGHAYHFYEAQSQDGSVDLGLTHCIRGRRVYAEGALTALRFLIERIEEGKKGVVYTMEDVLRGIS